MSSSPCFDAEVHMTYDPEIIYPKWQTRLIAAVAETNPNNLLERVKEAQKEISKRIFAISRSASHETEIEAIARAMDILRGLRRKARVSQRRPEYEELGQPRGTYDRIDSRCRQQRSSSLHR